MTLSELLKNDRFARAAGVEILDIRQGYAKARMEVTTAHLNFAAVANSYAQVTLSLSANINFLKAVSAGWLYAEAREIHHHPRIPYIEVRICQENGDLVAILNSTGYRKKDRLPIDNPSDTEQS